MTERVYLQMSAQQERNAGGNEQLQLEMIWQDKQTQMDEDDIRCTTTPTVTQKHITSMWLLTRGNQKFLILKRFCDVNPLLPVLLKGSVVKKPDFCPFTSL